MSEPLDVAPADPAARWEAMASAELAMSARLVTATEQLAAQMADRQAFMARLTGGLYWVPAPAMPLSSLPYIPAANGGPSASPHGTALAWAIQRVTVGPIGASTDVITIYKGRSSVDISPQNALTSLTGNAGTYPSWTPGRQGAVLMPGESLIVDGTITGTNPVLTWDVVVMDLDMLPLYLL
jgi:hypothetical protein